MQRHTSGSRAAGGRAHRRRRGRRGHPPAPLRLRLRRRRLPAPLPRGCRLRLLLLGLLPRLRANLRLALLPPRLALRGRCRLESAVAGILGVQGYEAPAAARRTHAISGEAQQHVADAG